MKGYAKPLSRLISELSKLPGIGGKTAQRLAFYILSMTDEEAKGIADAIIDAKTNMHYCSVCGNLTDTSCAPSECSISQFPFADKTILLSV